MIQTVFHLIVSDSVRQEERHKLTIPQILLQGLIKLRLQLLMPPDQTLKLFPSEAQLLCLMSREVLLQLLEDGLADAWVVGNVGHMEEFIIVDMV